MITDANVPILYTMSSKKGHFLHVNFFLLELEDEDDEIDETGQEYLEKLERSVSNLKRYTVRLV